MQPKTRREIVFFLTLWRIHLMLVVAKECKLLFLFTYPSTSVVPFDLLYIPFFSIPPLTHRTYRYLHNSCTHLPLETKRTMPLTSCNARLFFFFFFFTCSFLFYERIYNRCACIFNLFC